MSRRGPNRKSKGNAGNGFYRRLVTGVGASPWRDVSSPLDEVNKSIRATPASVCNNPVVNAVSPEEQELDKKLERLIIQNKKAECEKLERSIASISPSVENTIQKIIESPSSRCSPLNGTPAGPTPSAIRAFALDEEEGKICVENKGLSTKVEEGSRCNRKRSGRFAETREIYKVDVCWPNLWLGAREIKIMQIFQFHMIN